jgi:hypothetical protein
MPRLKNRKPNQWRENKEEVGANDTLQAFLDKLDRGPRLHEINEKRMKANGESLRAEFP